MAQKNKANNNVSDSNRNYTDNSGSKNCSCSSGSNTSGGSTKDSVAQFPDNRPARSGPGGN